MSNNILFGGKTFLMGGDFRQTPPVVNKGDLAKIIDMSIKQFVEENFSIFELKKNMRAYPKEIEFAQWLLKVGNGHKDLADDLIQIPNQCIVNDDLIDDIYKDLSIENFKDVCCLSPKNTFVDQMNNEVLNRKIPGQEFSKYR